MKIEVTADEGIGPEVTAQGKTQPLERGQAGIDSAGHPLPAATTEIARKADAILFGTAAMPGDEIVHLDTRPGPATRSARAGTSKLTSKAAPRQ